MPRDAIDSNFKTIFSACDVTFSAATSYDQNWGTQFEKLGEYKTQHGDCNVPIRAGSLGNWVSNMRSAIHFKYRLENGESLGKDQIKKANAMKPARINALEQLGFVSDFNQMLWDEMFNQLKNYMATHRTQDGLPDSNVPFGAHNDPSLRKLGNWVNQQRAEYQRFQKNQRSSITQNRINQLNNIGFQWVLGAGNYERKEQTKNISKWQEKFQLLLDYRTQHQGNVDVPQNHPELGNWVSHQRRLYHDIEQGIKPINAIRQQRIDQLNQIGFRWRIEPSERKRALGSLQADQNDHSTYQLKRPYRQGEVVRLDDI